MNPAPIDGIPASKGMRQSNFELLRIIAMLMIVIYHIALYSEWGGEAYSLRRCQQTRSSSNAHCHSVRSV